MSELDDFADEFAPRAMRSGVKYRVRPTVTPRRPKRKCAIPACRGQAKFAYGSVAYCEKHKPEAACTK